MPWTFNESILVLSACRNFLSYWNNPLCSLKAYQYKSESKSQKKKKKTHEGQIGNPKIAWTQNPNSKLDRCERVREVGGVCNWFRSGFGLWNLELVVEPMMSDIDKRWHCRWLPDRRVGEFLASLCDRREREKWEMEGRRREQCEREMERIVESEKVENVLLIF